MGAIASVPAAAIFVATLWLTGSALAEEAAAEKPAPPPPNADPTKLLLGDIGGVRPELTKLGIIPALTDIEETLGNVSGGVRRGLIFEGLTDFSLAYDLRPRFDWRGNFFARGYQFHGKGLSANYIDNLNTVSGIEETATTRLFELWYEQHIGDWLRIRIGQQSAGQEFLITTGAKPFVNSAFGWPTLPGQDLPSGGPSFPLATPAVRFTYQIQLRPGWLVQPDLQYIVNPGGGIPNPLMPPNRIRNALIGGVRTIINF